MPCFATHREGNDLIGIYKGTAELVKSLFYTVLSQPYTFTHVGKPTNETALSTWSELPRDTAFMGESVEPPRDPDRRYFAERLAQFAYEFLIAHELAHVRNGHVRSTTCCPSLEISELGGADLVPAEEGIVRQTLEMDADASATAQGLDNTLFAVGKPGRFASLLVDTETALSYWLYAIFGLFRLFAPTPIDLTILSNMKHPPARVRQMWTIQTGLARCEAAVLPFDTSHFMELAFETAALLDTNIARIAPEDPDKNALAIAFDVAVDEHLGVLQTKWCELLPILDPLAYVSNLATCLEP